MQASYTLLMLLYKFHACCTTANTTTTRPSSFSTSTCYHLLSHPRPGPEEQDVERLVEELRHGLESLLGAMMQDGGVFLHVGDMAREIEGALRVAFCE